MNTSTQFGIGSFLAGFTQGFEKTQELKMKQQEMELKQATLASEQAKLDLSLQKEANDKQIKTQQEMRKAQEILEIKPEAVSIASNGYYAVNYEMLGV